jgi:hypothetical protein
MVGPGLGKEEKPPRGKFPKELSTPDGSSEFKGSRVQGSTQEEFKSRLRLPKTMPFKSFKTFNHAEPALSSIWNFPYGNRFAKS